VLSVPSAALALWKSDRATRLDRLLAAHKHVRMTNSGRRWVTDELNHSLILRLASEFQGFARELHDDASEAVVAALAPGDADLQAALLLPYTTGRRLDRGNADPGALHQDFGLFGVDLWSALHRRYPSRAPKWHRQLQLLNTARNGLAHDDGQRIRQVLASGWLLTLPFIHRWRIGLDGLATGMDDVIGHYVHQTLCVRPW
jgi:hypothetical protein